MDPWMEQSNDWNQLVFGPDDSRLGKLQAVAQFFADWEDAVKDLELEPREHEKRLLSEEACNDLQSSIIGFISFVKIHFQNSHVQIVPSRVNSDIVENFFCSQRATCHGANDNPTHQQYKYAINSIIHQQAPISKKSNTSGKSYVYEQK
jgi:hypothetical protein